MSSDLRTLKPQVARAARELVRIARLVGYRPTVTSTFRSRSQQARLYRTWLAGGSRFPALPPGRSLHEARVAFDLVTEPYDVEALRDLGSVWESWGGEWGGDKDPVHFQARRFA